MFLASSARILMADMYCGEPSILITSRMVPFANLTAAVLQSHHLLVIDLKLDFKERSYP